MPFGVALADHEDHDGVRDHALVLVLVPALVDEVGVHEPRHVGLERELDHVGRQAALDGARLLARCGVGLAEADALALGGLVEGRDQLLVGLLRGGVGDERQLAAAAVAARRRRRTTSRRSRWPRAERPGRPEQPAAVPAGDYESSHCPPCQSTLPEAGKVAKVDRFCGECPCTPPEARSVDNGCPCRPSPTSTESPRSAILSCGICRSRSATATCRALFAARTGGGPANWCTFATWASKQAGQTIRKEDLRRAFERVFTESPDAESVEGRAQRCRCGPERKARSGAVSGMR